MIVILPERIGCHKKIVAMKISVCDMICDVATTTACADIHFIVKWTGCPLIGKSML